jgi:hypothetical protein
MEVDMAFIIGWAYKRRSSCSSHKPREHLSSIYIPNGFYYLKEAENLEDTTACSANRYILGSVITDGQGCIRYSIL